MAPKEYNLLIKKGLSSVIKTIKSQNEAIANLAEQYNSDEFSKLNLLKSLDILLSTKVKGGKIVICGVGKSLKIGSKLCATLNSLSIQSVTLHPTEALHGDLGILNDRDCILMLTASGNTPELINLLPHIPNKIPIILLTCSKNSKLSQQSQIKSLLYTELPSHLKEDVIHGIPAPTVSSTLSLILADSVILALAELIEDDVILRKKQFSIKHPGGSIGANLSYLNDAQSLGMSRSNSKSSNPLSSNSSFLSLEQIRHDLKLTLSPASATISPPSSTSSDDELDISDLAVKIAKSAPERVLQLTKEELPNDELVFLRQITLYDYWLIRDLGLGCESMILKKEYQKGEWENLDLISHFQQLNLDAL